MTSRHNDTLTTSNVHRVTLPLLDYITEPAVRAAAERYFDLDDQAATQMQAVQQATDALRDAQQADERATAAAIEQGKPTPSPRVKTKQAQDVLDDEKARLAAYQTALHNAHARLVEQVTEHAAAWSATVAVDHAEAAGRYAAHLAGLKAAERDLVATGSLLAMLAEPGRVQLGTYRPGAQLSIARSEAEQALDVVNAHIEPAATTGDDESDEGETFDAA